MSEDFLAREAAILGSNFSSSGRQGSGGEIDFDRAASAFPDLDDIGADATPVRTAPAASSANYDDDILGGFSSGAPATEVKVTGDDELERFENQFPDIGGVSV